MNRIKALCRSWGILFSVLRKQVYEQIRAKKQLASALEIHL